MLPQVFNEESLMELNDHWYQQVGASAHLSKVVLDWLETSFTQRRWKEEIVYLINKSVFFLIIFDSFFYLYYFSYNYKFKSLHFY